MNIDCGKQKRIVKTFGLKVDPILNAHYFHCFCKQISEDEKQKIKKYKFIDDAYRSVFANMLVRFVAVKFYRLKYHDIAFKYSEYGKPYLQEDLSFHFNISHTHEWIVCAVDQMPVGIDIECLLPRDISSIIRFFSKTEQDSFLLKEESQKLHYFYELWTLKESYIKKCGLGLSIPLNTFSINEKNNEFCLENQQNKDIFFKQYFIDEKYIMAVCANSNVFAPFVMTSLIEINDFFMTCCTNDLIY